MLIVIGGSLAALVLIAVVIGAIYRVVRNLQDTAGAERYERRWAEEARQEAEAQAALLREESTQRATAIERMKSEQREVESSHRREVENARREERSKVQMTQERLQKLAESLKMANSSEVVEGMVRHLIQVGSAYGQMITVKYLASPTARVGLEWVVHGPATNEVKVEVKLDGRVVKTDWALENNYGYQLARRGKPYTFSFDVSCGYRSWKDDVTFTLRIPTEREWARTPNGGSVDDMTKAFRAFNEERGALRKLKEEAMKTIDSSTLDEKEKIRWKADVDEFVIRQQEEQDQHASK